MCTSLSAIRSHSVQHPAIDVLGMKHLQSAISSFFFEMGIPQPLHQLMHTASFIKKIVITTRIQYENLLHLMDHSKFLQKCPPAFGLPG
jgi:hypothetical protein